jgi:signal transduction histidine kinase
MGHPTRWNYGWNYFLTAGIIYGGAVLRSLLAYQDSPSLGHVIGLLAAALTFFILDHHLSKKWSTTFYFYLILQITVIVALLFMSDFSDYFAMLFAILSMQIMQKMPLKAGVVCISLFSVLMMVPLWQTLGSSKAIAFTLVYSAMNAFLAAYSLALRRAHLAREKSQALGFELGQANQELQAYSQRVEQLAVATERNRLARELHDSVTQTVFSMTLTTQSALVLLERESHQVADQLTRLYQLARSAISEMHALISELNPIEEREVSLGEEIRRHLTDGHLPEDLNVSLEIEGDGSLHLKEAQALFRIVQEALNNVIKHADADQVRLRLHLIEPFWIEIEDDGRGFETNLVRRSSGIGMAGMDERSKEIGWELSVTSAPGAGTRIRVEKKRPRR